MSEGVVIASSCDAALSRTSTTLKPKCGKADAEKSDLAQAASPLIVHYRSSLTRR
jgi:hypothetical protein